MRSVLSTASVCVGVLCLLAISADAKLLSVTGQGVIVSANNPIPQYRLPANLYDQRNDDHEDSTSATIPPASTDPRRDLAITAFDEKRAMVPTDMTISDDPLVVLRAGVLYDSHFIFFHQKQPSTVQERAHARATFFTDNRFVGCTQTNDQEFDTTPIFGLTDQIEYPLSLATGFAIASRKFEPGDYVLGSGTQFNVNMNITQPGDYSRCFSAACVAADGQACECSFDGSSMCITPASWNEPRYHCFADANEIIAEPRFSFSSTCLVDKSSLEASVKECKVENGCRIHPTTGDYCILAANPPSTITLSVTGGCGCAKDVLVTFHAAVGGAFCIPGNDVIIDPPTVCGGNHPVTTVGTSCSAAHASSSTPGVTLQFSDAVTNCN